MPLTIHSRTSTVGSGPAPHLKMVVQGRHAEEPLWLVVAAKGPSAFEPHVLTEAGQSLGHEERPEHRNEQLHVQCQGSNSESRPDGQGARISHEDGGREAVPPQEPCTT